MLQACVDDSGNLYQGKTSVLVGYVASIESWVGFSNRWAAALAEPPAIAYLKASDAMALSKKGEFKGWAPEARDAKLSRLIDVINETPILYGAAAIVNNADFLRVASKHPDPKINDPFFFLFAQVLRGLIVAHRDLGPKEKVEFIFDSTSQAGHHLADLFRDLMFTAPTSIQALGIADAPTFRDEKDFLPLQAADLAVNRVRNFFERYLEDETAKPGWILDRLGESGVKLAMLYSDASYLETTIRGAELVKMYLDAGPPEIRAERFARLREWIEGLPEPTKGL